MNTLDGTRAVRLADALSHGPQGEIDGHDRVASGPFREILAKHLPNADGKTCVACDFTYTPTLPLCPPVATALRELSLGDARSHTPKSPLARYTTAKLRALASKHTGEGRCQRCGFIYSTQIRQCPTSRRIFTELESRGTASLTQPRADQGLCAGKGAGWTVNGNQSAPWKRAMAACSVCPLLAQCTAELEKRLTAGKTVREQIQAGRLFTITGREIELEKIEEFAVARGRTKNATRKTRKQEQAALTPAPTAVPEISTVPALPAKTSQLSLFDVAAA